MAPGNQALSLAALLAGAAFASATGQEPSADGAKERPLHTRIDLPSAEACGGCHARELAEWSSSLHGRAWTNANIRAATKNFAQRECRPCHSPLPVLATGLDVRPDFRDFNQTDGVHCLSCHGLAGGVAAARTIAGAPCRPLAEPRLARSELCWPCHEPTHQAFQEYQTSQAFAAGKRCQDCHMPARAEGGGHTHSGLGGFNEEFVRRAIGWEARLEGRELVLQLENRTGHKFPGEISSRSFLIRVHFPGHEPADLFGTAQTRLAAVLGPKATKANRSSPQLLERLTCARDSSAALYRPMVGAEGFEPPTYAL